MDHPELYTSLIVPVVLGLVLLFVFFKIVSAIVKTIALFVLIAVAVGGFFLYSRIHAVQNAVEGLSSQGSPSIHTNTLAFEQKIRAQANQAVASVGLNPNDLMLTLHCQGAYNTQLTVRYVDDKFLFGMLNKQEFSVPVSSGCDKQLGVGAF